MNLVNIILILIPLALLSFICAMLCFCALAIANRKKPIVEEIVMADGTRWFVTDRPFSEWQGSPDRALRFMSAVPATNLNQTKQHPAEPDSRAGHANVASPAQSGPLRQHQARFLVDFNRLRIRSTVFPSRQ